TAESRTTADPMAPSWNKPRFRPFRLDYNTLLFPGRSQRSAGFIFDPELVGKSLTTLPAGYFLHDLLFRFAEAAEREESRAHVLLLHDRFELRHNLRMLGGDVHLLRAVGGEVVKFRWRRLHLLGLRSRVHIAADGFPVADANALLPAVSRCLAIEEWPRFLGFPKQCWRETDAVDVRRRLSLGPDQFQEGRQPVFEAGHAIARAARLDVPRPTHDARFAEPRFVIRSLGAAEAARTVEERRIRAAVAVI